MLSSIHASFDWKYFKFLKFQNCEMRSRGLMRKILRKPTETLRKPYGNPTEILERFSGKILRKSYGNPAEAYGNPTEAYGSFRRQIPKTPEAHWNFSCGNDFYPTEALLKPYGSPTEGLFENQNYCGSFRRSLYIILHRCTPPVCGEYSCGLLLGVLWFK